MPPRRLSHAKQSRADEAGLGNLSWMKPFKLTTGRRVSSINGERHRCGERISTGFVESTINQLIAKRFVIKPQMRWTPRGAHLLLQIRVQALNDDLRETFERWYPDLRHRQEEQLAA
jgi:hypothetical protein